MENQPDKIIKISRNCDEISAHNFFEMNKTKDFSWLIPGFDGWEEITAFPINTPLHWENIINEYSAINKNNKTLQYFELLMDLSELEARIFSGKVLIYQLERRWNHMDAETRESYIKELLGHRFYFNKSKPLDREFKKINNQFEVISMKIESIKKRIEPFENDFKDNDSDQLDIIDVKIKIQNILKRDIDLRKMSIKEFTKTLKSLTHKKAA